MQATLILAVRDGRPVIPVLLPDAPAVPQLPVFLGMRTWVDLRRASDQGPDEGLRRLIWGIPGRHPGEGVGSPASSTASSGGWLLWIRRHRLASQIGLILTRILADIRDIRDIGILAGILGTDLDIRQAPRDLIGKDIAQRSEAWTGLFRRRLPPRNIRLTTDQLLAHKAIGARAPRHRLDRTPDLLYVLERLGRVRSAAHRLPDIRCLSTRPCPPTPSPKALSPKTPLPLSADRFSRWVRDAGPGPFPSAALARCEPPKPSAFSKPCAR